MASPSTSTFVVWDFTIGGTLPSLRDSFVDPAYERFVVRWPGNEGVPPAGHLWQDVVEPGIRGADRCLAFVDKPNANVGFEIGYALGLGRPVALAHLTKAAADWTQASPLRGIMNPRLQTSSEVEECLAQKDWKRLASPPKPGTEVLLLCSEVAGDPYLRKLREAMIPFRTLQKDGWSIDDLPKQLEGVGLVLWWVLPHNEGPEARDGDDNARLAVVAGYARALTGVCVEAAWDPGARAVADILGTERDLPPPTQIVGFAQALIETWQAESRKAQQLAPPVVTVDGLACALVSAWIYEHPTQGFESLIRELPAAVMPGAAEPPGSSETEGLEAGAGEDFALWLPWLEAQARRSGSWSREELAALDLLAVLLGPDQWGLPVSEAHRTWERLRGAIDQFGVERVPRRAEVADRCEDLGDALDPDLNVPCRFGMESVEAYQMAIRLGRSGARLMCNLGRGLEQRLGRYAEAEVAYRKGMDEDPECARPHYELGDLLRDHLGRYEEAEAEYRKAMELDPKEAYPHNALCLLYQFHLDQWREAGEAIQRAIELAPDDFAYRETQGLYLEESGDLDGAERSFREGLQCQPGELDNTVGIGWVALQSRNDLTAVREALASLSVTDRARPSATLLEAGLVVWEGNWAEAQLLLARWLRELPTTLSPYPWTQRSRWCALIRRSGVPVPWEDWHRLFAEASGTARWTEWIAAIEALREGRPAAELSERRTRWITERLTRPGQGV